jgi:hypothetical protein
MIRYETQCAASVRRTQPQFHILVAQRPAAAAQLTMMLSATLPSASCH